MKKTFSNYKKIHESSLLTDVLFIIVSPVILGYIFKFITLSSGLSGYWSIAYLILCGIAMFLIWANSENKEFRKSLNEHREITEEKENDDFLEFDNIVGFFALAFAYTSGFIAFSSDIWGIFKFSLMMIALTLFILVVICFTIECFKAHATPLSPPK